MIFFKKVLVWCIISFFGFCLFKNVVSNSLPNQNRGIQDCINKGVIDNLFIGSSMFRQGIDIDSLNESSNGINYILSYNGLQPFAIETILKILLQHNCIIKNLYVDMYAFSIVSSPKISDKRLIWDLNLSDKIKIFNKIYSGWSFSAGFDFFGRLNNEYFITHPISNYLVSKRYKNGGRIRSLNESELTSIQLSAREPMMLNALKKGINEVQLQSISGLIIICKQNNINVVFCETPKHAVISKNEIYNRVMNKYVSFLKEKNVKYILGSDIPNFSDNSSFFQDFVHLSCKGSKSFTNYLLKNRKNIKK